MRNSFESYSGKDLELDLLGEGVKPAARYDGKYKNFHEAEMLVKANQPDGWNPENPPLTPSKFPGDFYFMVQESFAREFGELEERFKEDSLMSKRLALAKEKIAIRFWNATGSDLDHDYGTDAFFTVSIDQFEEVVLIDITQNPEKAERGAKADVVVLLRYDQTYDGLNEKEQEVFLKNYADQVASRLASKTVPFIERRRAA